MLRSENCNNLSFNTAVYSWYTIDKSEIPLYCIGSLGSIEDPFGIGLIMASFHCQGSQLGIKKIED